MSHSEAWKELDGNSQRAIVRYADDPSAENALDLFEELFETDGGYPHVTGHAATIRSDATIVEIKQKISALELEIELQKEAAARYIHDRFEGDIRIEDEKRGAKSWIRHMLGKLGQVLELAPMRFVSPSEPSDGDARWVRWLTAYHPHPRVGERVFVGAVRAYFEYRDGMWKRA